jgi:threonine dehydrogenase-like Zn-dependent dehydrogenase
VRALVFGVEPQGFTAPAEANELARRLAVTPVALQQIPDAKPLRPDWVVARPILTGICGSDSKQVLLDFGEGDSDSPLSGFCTFPQVMGHEVVARVTELGPRARGLDVGQRVVLNPWLSCAPRGVAPLCPACQAGDLSLCWSFTTGPIATGIHTGVSADATGGYADLVPAHDSMWIPIPDDVSDEHAVLADPFAVSLHSITRNPPPPDGKVIVWGAGALGSCAIAILRALHPSVEIACIARFAAQQKLARQLGASVVLGSDDRVAILEQLAAWSGGQLVPLLEGMQGLPMCHPGKVDVVYDTVGKPETFEIGVRLLKARGTLVKSGVHAPGRWEWSPLYFKEIHWVGSNAFGVEEVEGRRQHGIRHYLDLVRDGRIDLRAMLTHRFPLEEWQAAFYTIAMQGTTGAIKVAITGSAGS